MRAMILAAVAAAATMTAAASAQTVEEVLGGWSGVLTTPGGELPLVITLKQDDAGVLAADLESPAQAPNLKIPATAVAVTDGQLTFAVSNLNASYAGTWSAETETWVGTFTQGADLPLTLERGRPE